MITQRRAERPPLSAGRRSRLALGLAMGKKSRAVPGRRPILQLSPPGPRSNTPGRDPEPEPDTEPDSTVAAPSQPAPAAPPPPPPPTTTTTVTAAAAAAAAPDDSPSESKGARGAPTLRWGVRNSSSGLAAYGEGRGRRRNPGRGGGASCTSEACCVGPQGRTAEGPGAARARPAAREAPSLVRGSAWHPECPRCAVSVLHNLRRIFVKSTSFSSEAS